MSDPFHEPRRSTNYKQYYCSHSPLNVVNLDGRIMKLRYSIDENMLEPPGDEIENQLYKCEHLNVHIYLTEGVRKIDKQTCLFYS